MNKGGLIFLVVLLLLVSLVSAANVGVSPADIHFKNVLRNGYAERPIVITIDSEEEVDINLSSRGDISSWLTYPKENVTTRKGSPTQLIVEVSPPAGTPNGIYEGFLRIRSTELSPGREGFATGLIIPTLDVYITVEVTDQEFLECEASDFIVESTEEGEDIIFSVDIKNTGNIRFFPEITFDIWDQEGLNIVKKFIYKEQEVTPTQKEELTIKVPSEDLDLGQYWVDINSIECYSKRTLTFDVLEEGALRANGALERIVVNPWADLGEIVPISANFKNTGEKSLDARFVGKVTYNNKIVQLLESDESQFTRIGEDSNFQFYFTPRQEGRYIVSGRIFYDGKRTFEQSAILNVKPTGIISKAIRAGVYVALIAIISFLIFRIRKERRMLKGLKNGGRY